jgi:mannose-6-phosphate isomerase-like protein (cupin superfamily)
MIKNFCTAEKQLQNSSHGGTGPVDLYEIWGSDNFQSDIDFCDRVVIPPGSTIGYHQHGNNEEMYILLEGEGLMTMDGKKVVVGKGDMILNPADGHHGLVNNSAKDIDLLAMPMIMSWCRKRRDNC